MTDKLEIEVGQVFSTPTKTLTDAHFLFFSSTGDNHPTITMWVREQLFGALALVCCCRMTAILVRTRVFRRRLLCRAGSRFQTGEDWRYDLIRYGRWSRTKATVRPFRDAMLNQIRDCSGSYIYPFRG